MYTNWPKSLTAFNPKINKNVVFDVLEGDIPNDMYVHIFLFVMYYTDKSDYKSQLWIFESLHIENGPICKLGHDNFKMASAVHGTWVKKIKSPSDLVYNIKEDYGYHNMDIETQEIFDTHVIPHFVTS